MDDLYLWILAVAVFAGIRFVAGVFDRERIKKYVESRGGKLLVAKWQLGGPGSAGTTGERFYSVRYRDRDGDEHHAYCKTSMLAGVYFTQDSLLTRNERNQETREHLAAENRRLRTELNRMKGRERGPTSDDDA
jgi:hypothetical protein